MENPDKLIDAWLDGSLDEEGVRELNAWLVDSKKNADYFAERTHIHSRLYDWAKAIGSCGVDDVVDSVARSVAFNPPKKRWQVKVIAAAVVIGLVSLFLLKSNPLPVAGEPVATLMESPGVALSYLGREMPAGESILRAGEYQLTQGIASVEYESGVTLLIESPASFRMVSSELVKLTSGRIAAHVPPAGVGFTIKTPSADVVDFGTDFAVDVGLDRSSEVHVFEGEVEVQPREGQVDPVRLLTNAATRVEFESEVPLGIPVDQDRFLRSLEEPPLEYSKVIQSQMPAVYYRMGIPWDGSTMKDVIGESHAQIQNHGTERPFTAAGRVGASGRFMGAKEGYHLEARDYPKTGKHLTVSAWVTSRTLPRLACIVANEGGSLMGQFRLGLYRDTGLLQVRVRQSDNSEAVARDTEIFPSDIWQHIAFVADGKMLRLFRNGKEVAAVPCGDVGMNDVATLFVGAQDDVEGKPIHFWHGRVDEVAIFNHALSDEDIALQFQSVPSR